MAFNEKLNPIFCKCGIFRKHKNQISANPEKYYEELGKKFFYKKNIFRFFISLLYFVIFFYKF